MTKGFVGRTTIGRRSALVAALAVAAIALTSCAGSGGTASGGAADTTGTDPGTSSSEAATTQQATAQQETGAAPAVSYPITLPTQYGDVVIKSAPQRVVALTADAADELLSLGINPIAVALDPATVATTFPWLVGKVEDLADASLVSAAGVVNLEAIAQLKPDLILGTTWQFTDKALFERSNSIAPTVIPDSTALNVDWDDRLLNAAAPFGLTDKAQGLIDQIRADFAAVGADVPGIESMTYQFVRADPDGYGFGNGSVLELFGLKPAANQDNTQNGPPLSKENTAQLNADLLGVWAPTGELRDGLDADPLFQALPAVKNGTVFYADLPTAFAANTPAPMALAWLKGVLAPTVTALG